MVSVATTQLCHRSSEAATDDMWMVGVAVLPENVTSRTSLVGQWLRIRLSMQGTQVPEDSTCHGATKPMCYNC